MADKPEHPDLTPDQMTVRIAHLEQQLTNMTAAEAAAVLEAARLKFQIIGLNTDLNKEAREHERTRNTLALAINQNRRLSTTVDEQAARIVALEADNADLREKVSNRNALLLFETLVFAGREATHAAKRDQLRATIGYKDRRIGELSQSMHRRGVAALAKRR